VPQSGPLRAEKQNTRTLPCGCRKSGSENQETFAPLRQRVNAAPPTSKATARVPAAVDTGCQKAHIVWVRLEFDPDKEAINLAKHGVDFSTVQKVFQDPQRMIVPNETHSSGEPRFYAVGHDGHGILTVRFTLRGEAIRVIGAGYWRKQKKAYEDQKKETELR
jgi:hypothetical protein